MDFFDKIGKKASQAYKATAEKTNKITREAKLKMKNSENKSAIEELYKEIGKKVYEKHVRQEDINIEKELEEECTKIDVLAAEIETNLNECLELRDKIKCEKCSALIDKSSKFCSECGSKVDVTEVTEIVETTEDEQKTEMAKEVEVVEENNEENK